MRSTFLLLLLAVTVPARLDAKEPFEDDLIKTSGGELKITFIGHGTLMFRFGGKVIHIDPVSREADYSKMPKADLVLITHEHGDHLDPAAVEEIRTEDTRSHRHRTVPGRSPARR